MHRVNRFFSFCYRVFVTRPSLSPVWFQHFAETKRTQQNLANAPSCAYHLNPPLEVKEALAGSSQDSSANGGYMSFSIFSRHVSSPDKVSPARAFLAPPVKDPKA